MAARILRLFFGVLLMSAFVAGQTPPARSFKTIELTGTPYERGVQHGRLLQSEIRELIELWKASLRLRARMDPDAVIRKFAASTNYTAAIEKWAPDLLEEVRGIADGANIDFTTMLVYQLPDEVGQNGRSILRPDHCSAVGIAATSTHPGVVAQTMDIPGFHDGTQTILHITQPSGLQQFVLTVPGLIALNGMNSKGVAITANTLWQLAHAREGLPVAFVLRGVLERTTFNAAREFVMTVHHASGQNYTIGGDDRVAYFEASSNRVVQFDAPGSGAFIFHTNDPLVNDDYSSEGAAAAKNPDTQTDSQLRYAALQKRLASAPAGDVVETIQQALRSQDSQEHPVSHGYAGPMSTFTFASTVMVLGPDPHLIAAPGPPHQYGYSLYRFTPAADNGHSGRGSH